MDEKGHEWEEYTVDQAASCTENGSQSIHCKKCEAVKDSQEIVATGHIVVTDAAVAATCTATGLTEGSHCSVCKEVLVAQTVTEKAEHSAVTDAAVPATCTATGLSEGSHCSVCKEVLVAQTVTEKTGHSYGDWKIIKDSKCSEKGFQIRSCQTCGFSDTKNVDEKGHEWEEYTVDQAASCTENGSQSIHCKKCEAITNSQVIAATGHNAVTDEAVAATCTATGLSEGSHCSVCKEVLVAQTVTEKVEHTAATDAAVPATCTATGLSEGSHCSVCKEVLVAQSVTEKVEHTAVTDAAVPATCTATGLSEGSHCSVCKEVLVTQTATEKAEHSAVTDAAVAATCTATGLSEGSHCSVCKEVLVAQTTTEKTGHSYGDWETIKVAKCDEEGFQIRKCSICGFSETQKSNPTEHEWNDDYTVDKEAKCGIKGSKSIHCKKCDATKDRQEIEATSHNYGDWEIIKEAKCEEKGYQTRECSTCGFTDKKWVDATGHSYTDGICTVCKKAETFTKDGLVYTVIVTADGTKQVSVEGMISSDAMENGTLEIPISVSDGNTEFQVTKVAANAFTDNQQIQSLILPESVKEIEENAFAGCSTLSNITFRGNEAPKMDDSSFNDISKDTEVSIPAGSSGYAGMKVEHVHKLATDAAVAATCTKAGKTEGSHCTICNEVIVAQTSLAAKGHKAVTDKAVLSTVFKTGLTQGSHCSVCKAVIKKQTVTAKLKPSIKLSASSKTLKKSKKYTLLVTGMARGDSVKSFAINKKTVATVSNKGLIVAKKKGKAVITVTLKSGKTAKCTVTVK